MYTQRQGQEFMRDFAYMQTCCPGRGCSECLANLNDPTYIISLGACCYHLNPVGLSRGHACLRPFLSIEGLIPSSPSLPNSDQFSVTSAMPPTCPVTAISSASNFQSIFSTALKAYERRTKTDILAHPLASQLQACTSPGSILAVLQGQANDLAQAQGGDERLTKWLNPTVNVLLAFSNTLGSGISLVRLKMISSWVHELTCTQVFSPATVIFAGAGVLLQVRNFLDASSPQPSLIVSSTGG